MTKFNSLALAATLPLLAVSAFGAAHANLEPMLDPEVVVPNDATLRLFRKAKVDKRLCRVFEESPYQKHLAMRYNREETWYHLEPEKGVYRFDELYEPFFKQALAEHSRVQIGFVYTCGGGLRGDPKRGFMPQDKLCVLPKWLFDELQASDHPMALDEAFGGGWTPDYDSPILIERFRRLAMAFSAWLQGEVAGTNVRRIDMLNGIEMRYFGYWGEGLVRHSDTVKYPKDERYDQFIDIYEEAFPTVLLISSHQQTYHCTSSPKSLKENPRALRAAKHMGRIYASSNQFGRFGFFTDCWDAGNFNKHHRLLILVPGETKPRFTGKYRQDVLWGNSYQTGEFAYFIRKPGNNGRVAYDNLEADFWRNHQSSLSVHNFSIINRTIGKPDPKAGEKMRTFEKPTDEILGFGRRALAMTGYRFVLGSPEITKRDGFTHVAFTLENVGASRMFHDHYQLEAFVEDASGRTIERNGVSFDLRTLGYQDAPIKYDPAKATRVEVMLKTTAAGTVRLVGRDRQNICLPLCFSNWGRRAEDGSYLLGEIR